MSIAPSLDGGVAPEEATLPRRILLKLAAVVAFFIAAQCIYTSYFGAPESTIHRSVIFLLCTFVAVILYPCRPSKGSDWMVFSVWLGRLVDLAIVILMSYGVWRFIDNLEDMEYLVSEFDILDRFGALGCMLAVMEMTP